ncbi:MAG TPA: DMT family transporter [Ramlibacter sp.]|uniref:DMT family transporter n=1 Tax=Ramlibacter sp. TaxID=1917967 RepID=UPI002C258F9C|nr:DMT family transporter [Ramlibacter sp.]HVZ42559.1 DMT family transporter [Ramlibacter sp.]
MIQRKERLDTLAASVLLACCLFWGFQQVLVKTTVSEVPPLWQAAMRFGGATLLLWLWCAMRGIPLFERDGTLRAGLLAGALFAAEFACVYLGLRDTTASRLTVFLYTAPFVVALVLPRFAVSERLSGMQWTGLVIAFAAVAFAFSEAFAGAVTARQLRGDALALAAGTLWGFTTVVIRTSAMASSSAEKTLFYQVAVASAVAPLLSLALGERWSLDYSAYAWTSIAVQIAIGGFASFLAWMWLLRHYPATHMSSFSFLTPVFALVFGVALLSEPLTPRLVLALVGVAAGIVLVNRRARMAR